MSTLISEIQYHIAKALNKTTPAIAIAALKSKFDSWQLEFSKAETLNPNVNRSSSSFSSVWSKRVAPPTWGKSVTPPSHHINKEGISKKIQEGSLVIPASFQISLVYVSIFIVKKIRDAATEKCTFENSFSNLCQKKKLS